MNVHLAADGEIINAQETWETEAAARVEETEARATEAEELAKRAGAIRVAGDVHVGRAFIDDGRNIDAFSRLSRYEAHIQRSMFKAIDQLRRLQTARAAANGLAPLELESRIGKERG